MSLWKSLGMIVSVSPGRDSIKSMTIPPGSCSIDLSTVHDMVITNLAPPWKTSFVISVNIPLPSEAFPRRARFEPGDRSTRYGGVWHLCRAPGGRCEIQSEFGTVIDRLPEAYADLAEEQFGILWEKAQIGKLNAAHPYYEMRTLKTEPQPPPELAAKGVLPPVLLEIRLQINETDPEPENQILLRLYYAEPEGFDRLMLAIHFARKPGGGDPGGVQQEQIMLAGRRYYNGLKKDYNWGYPSSS